MPSIPRICSIDNCDRKHYGKGLCSLHANRLKQHGDVNYVNPDIEYHGFSKTSLYKVWAHIKQRTQNESNPYFFNYGGRGIKICNRWFSSFVAFHEDVGDKPSKVHTIDRIDNDGNYSCGKCDECQANNWPMNVRWATRSQQSLNQRRGRVAEFGYRGVTRYKNKYQARVSQTYVGLYKTPEEAALAYNKKAIELFGVDANLNVIE